MKNIKNLVLLFLVITIWGCNTGNNKIQNNKATAVSFIEAWSNHDAEKLNSLFSDNCLYEEVCRGIKYSQKEQIASYLNSTISGIPDLKFEINSVSANDSVAMIEYAWSGTNVNGWPQMNIPATNKHFKLKAVSVMSIKNNLITYNRDYWDWNSFLVGIGIE